MSKVYINGFVGNLGTKIIIENKYEELSRYFNVLFLKKVLKDIDGGLNPPLFMAEDCPAVEDKIYVSKGGLLTSLWEICERNKVGLKYSLMTVPILQGTIEISNYFDLNPYRLLTTNSEIIFIKESSIEKLSDSEKNQFKNYVLIGETISDKKKVRIDNDIESFLTKDYKDEIEKILPRYIKEYEKYNNS